MIDCNFAQERGTCLGTLRTEYTIIRCSKPKVGKRALQASSLTVRLLKPVYVLYAVYVPLCM